MWQQIIDLLEQLVALLKQVLHLQPNPDGTLDTATPNGDKAPDAGTAAWGDLSAIAAAIQSTTVSSGVSVNVRSALTGTAALTASIGVTVESGSDVTATGWNQPGSGNSLTISSSTQGSGALRLTATPAGGNTVVSDPIPWARVVAVVGDTLAPGAVTGLKGTPVAGGIAWSFDAPNDQHDGTRAGTGAKSVDLELNGSVTTITVPPGITAAPTATNIGSISSPGAPTAVQSGRNWTLTAAGTGIDGTSDQALFLNWPVSGDCSITAKIASFTGTGDGYAPAALAIREDLTEGSKYVALVRLLSQLSNGFQGKQRVIAGGARATIASLIGDGTGAYWLRLERAGDVFTLLYSTDGLAWTALASTTVAMSASVYIGVLVSSQQAGSNVAAQFNDVNPSTTPRITYSQTTASATHARARARDLAGTPNVGAYSALTADVTPLAAAPLVKWHPLHFVCTSTINQLPSGQVSEVAGMKAVAPEVGGIGLYWSWRAIETARGNYSGLAALQAAVDACWAAGLRVWIFIQDDTFSGTARNCPDYLTSETGGDGGIYVKANGGTTPKVWNHAVMLRCIALFQQLAAAFDTHPAVEVIQYRELDTGFGGSEYTAANFSYNAFFGELYGWVDAMKAAWPHTNIAAPANYSGDPSYMEPWVKYCRDRAVGLGGPDIYPQDPYRNGGSNKLPTWTDQVHRGNKWNSANWVSGGTDYRGVIPYFNQIQDPELGRGYVWPPLAFYQYGPAIDGLAQSHFLWWRKDYAFSQMVQNLQVYWSRSDLQPDASMRIKPFLLQGGHTLRTTPPSCYGGNVDTT